MRNYLFHLRVIFSALLVLILQLQAHAGEWVGLKEAKKNAEVVLVSSTGKWIL